MLQLAGVVGLPAKSNRRGFDAQGRLQSVEYFAHERVPDNIGIGKLKYADTGNIL